jgi:hypothetical protein
MSNLILDLFTEFQTKMRAESALLMAKVMEIAHATAAPSSEQGTIERLEVRLAALEKQLKEAGKSSTPTPSVQKTPVKVQEKPVTTSSTTGSITPQKRRHSDAQEPSEVKPSEVIEAPNATTLIISPLEAMTLEEDNDNDNDNDNDIEMSESSPKRPRQEEAEEATEESGQIDNEDSEEVEEAEEEEAEEEVAEEEVAEEEVAEEEVAEEEVAEEEVAEEEVAEEEEAAEELTEFTYKGKKYFMDSECQVYGLDADGELNSDPIGIYDEKTRRITFHA